jgi:hypothetical protein
MSRSRSRLAADWFAKLRVNAGTQAVEHEDVEVVDAATTTALAAKADTTYVNTAIGNIDMTAKADVTYVDNALSGISSSSTSSDFTVATGKTVVAGTVANLFNGEIGTNPVANTLGTEQSYSAETFNKITGDGNAIVKAYSNGSGHHYIKTIRTSDMTVVSDVAAYTGYTSAGTDLGQLSDNRFVVYGRYRNSSGTLRGSYWDYQSFAYAVMFEVSATGVITKGNTYTTSNWSGYGSPSIWIYVKNFKGTNKGGLHIRKYNQHYNGSWQYDNYYYAYTVPHTGSLNLSSVWSGQDSNLRHFGDAIFNSAVNKFIQPSTSTTWKMMSWNGSSVSSMVDVTNNRTNLSTAKFIKPDPTQDKLLCFYINTNLELCVETLNWTSSSVDVVANSKWIVEADASGVSLGEIKGSTNGVGITYENGSKGRFKSLSLDSNMVVTGSSSLMTVNSSNVVPGLAYKGSDKFQAWNNNVDTYTNEITVNAYSTSPLIPLGVITENGTGGDTVSVATTGVVGGFTGLTVDSKYYYDTSVFDGTVTLTNTGTHVGRAVSTTEILLTDLTEQ